MAGSAEPPTSPESPQHSTLELIKHDATLAAPERDYAVVAPERSSDGDAPQTAPVSGPEIFYSDSPPEAIPTIEKRNSTHTGSLAKPSSSRLSSRMVIVITATIAAVTVGLAVGMGVGLGLKRQSGTTSSNVSTTVPGIAASTSPASSMPSTSPLTDKQILDDTSIAALALPNGDRRVFFQDLSGVIRQAFHSSSSGEWRADTNYVVASNARNHTPIAAVNVPSKNYSATGNSTTLFQVLPTSLAVFYVSVNNSLACVQINDGAWGDSNPQFANISHFTAAANSRHLTVTVNPEAASFNTSLVYESVDEAITFLEASLTISTSTNFITLAAPSATIGSQMETTIAVAEPVWTWKNSTAKLQAARQNNSLLFAAPFTSSFAGGSTEILFTAKHRNGSYSDKVLMAIVFGYDGSFSTNSYPENMDPTGIQKSDLVTIASTGDPSDSQYGFCVKDKRLALLGTDYMFKTIPSMPSTPYPFARLARLTPAIGTNFFIYHQLNASTFAEDQWDDTVGGWVSNLFSIATA